MNPQAKNLVLAILTRIEERDGSANRTKLLKLLYLADIENFRATRQTLTGFDWIFYLYGPWAPQFDELLGQLQAEGVVDIEKWATQSIEGERVKPKEHIPFEKLTLSTEAFFRFRRQVDTWADRGIASLLDYVYFETEPMQDAVKGKRLDFSKISKEAPKIYNRPKSGAEKKDLQRLRKKILEVRKCMADQRAVQKVSFDSAPHDDAYIQALSILDNEES